MDFEDKLSEVKEKMFKKYVLEASKILNLPFVPTVKIWDDRCPYSKGNEIAHAHPDTGQICISRLVLNSLTLDEIEQTAIHETTHMLHLGHGGDFLKTKDETELANWLLSHIRGKTEKKNITKPDKIDEKLCNYHLCKKRTKLYKCKYCGSYFCKEHLKPKPPVIPDYESTKAKDRLLLEEYRKTGGHPCFPYLNKWVAKQEKKKKEYEKVLDRLLKSGPIDFEAPSREKEKPIAFRVNVEDYNKIQKEKQKSPEEINPEIIEHEEKLNVKKKNRRITPGKIIFSMLLVIFAYLLYNYWDMILPSIFPPEVTTTVVTTSIYATTIPQDVAVIDSWGCNLRDFTCPENSKYCNYNFEKYASDPSCPNEGILNPGENYKETTKCKFETLGEGNHCQLIAHY